MANFLKKRGAWDTPVTKVSSYVGADAAKPAEKKDKPKLDAKVLNSYVGKKMAEAAVKMRQPGYNPPKQEHISSAEDQPDSEMIVPILGAKKSLGKIKEAAAVAPPFDKPYKKVVGTVTDKSGAKHSPMSRARDLARKGMKQMMQINPKIAEGWSDAALDQLDEVHPSVNAQSEGYIDFTRPSGAAYDATMVKGKMVITPNKPYEPYGAAPAKKKVTKLPMSQAAGALAAEAVTYSGMGTDVVDKKKKLNPQPNLMMKPKQVKDFKEEAEELDELSDKALKKYLHHSVGVGSGDANYKEKTPGYKNKGDYNSLIAHKQDHEDLKYDPETHRDDLAHAKQKMHARKQGIDRAVNKLVAKNPANKLSGDYIKATTGLKNKQGVVHVKAPEGNPSATTPYEHPKETGAQNNRISRARGRSRTTGVHRAIERIKEENLDELKLTTMQNYADKAHQQAMDATYDAAHLNRTGEEKLKADAKRIAAKRAGGVQRAQTKMDRMQEDHITSANDITEALMVDKPRTFNVRHLKPAGHGIVGKKVRSYDFPGMHDSHYIEGHVTDEDHHSYHIRTTKVVRHDKEEPVPAHLMHIRAPKGISLFGGAQGVYYAPRDTKPAVKKTMRSIRGKK